MSIKSETEEKMKHAVEHLKEELHSIRTGRANPAMVSGLKVSVYGSEMRLQDVASITTPESRQLLITPYDKGTVNSIAKSIQEADIGFMPNVDGAIIRINIPAMDDALRKKMVKLINEYREKAKVVVRNERQNSNKKARTQKNDGDIAEDELKHIEKAIQDFTDKYCAEVDKLCDAKEKEISTI